MAPPKESKDKKTEESDASNLLQLGTILEGFIAKTLNIIKKEPEEGRKRELERERDQCILHFEELETIAYFMGKISNDLFYRHCAEKACLKESDTPHNRQATELFFRGYGHDGLLFPRLTVADRSQVKDEEMRAAEAGNNIVLWWSDIRLHLSQKDSADRLQSFFSLPADERRRHFDEWATELLTEIRVRNPRASPGKVRLPEKNRPDIRLFCDELVGLGEYGVHGSGRWTGLIQPVFKNEPPKIQVYPDGRDESLNPWELPLLAPLLNWENLSNSAFLASFLINRAQHHPAHFASRDLESTYIARSIKWVQNPYYVDNYTLFCNVKGVPYPAFLHHDEYNTDTPEARARLHPWQSTGRAYAQMEGRTIILSQLYIYGFIRKLVRFIFGQPLSLAYRIHPHASSTQLCDEVRDENYVASQGMKSVVKKLIEEERDTGWFNDTGSAYSHSVRMQQYSGPTTIDLETWKTIFRDHRDASVKHLWRLMNDLTYFRDQAQVQIDHHYGQIKPLPKNMLTRVPPFKVRKNFPYTRTRIHRAANDFPHFHHDKRKQHGAKDAKRLEIELMEEITRRILWCAMRDLEHWEHLFILTDKLQKSLQIGNVDLSDRESSLEGDQLAHWMALQTEARFFFEDLITEINPRWTLVSAPLYRQWFGRCAKGPIEGNKERNIDEFIEEATQSHFSCHRNSLEDDALFNIAKAEKQLATATTEEEKAQATRAYERAVVATFCCTLGSHPVTTSLLGFENAAHLLVPAVEAVHKAGTFTRFATDIVVHICQLARFVAEMEETRRMDPSMLRNTITNVTNLVLPHCEKISEIRKQRIVSGPLQGKTSHLKQVFSTVLTVLDTKEAKRRGVAESLRGEKEKKGDVEALGRVWASIINHITGVQAKSLDDYRESKTSQKLLEKVASEKVGAGLCKFLLTTHDFDEDGEEEDNPDDDGPGQSNSDKDLPAADGSALDEEGDTEMTGVSESEADNFNDETDGGDDGDDYELSQTIRPDQRVRPSDSKFLKEQNRQNWANRGGRRGLGPARGLAPVTPKVKLKQVHWNTFAALQGKKTTVTVEDVFKAMGAIGFSVVPQLGSMYTVGWTNACMIPENEPKRKSIVIHSVHARDEKNRKDVIRSMGSRFNRDLAVTRRNLIKYYEGGPAGGWR